MITISLEGNIGSNKEQFLYFLRKMFNVSFVNYSENCLRDFYKDPGRWATIIELNAIIQKFVLMKDIADKSSSNELVITHRSIYSDKECFVKACCQMKYMSAKETDVFNSLYNIIDHPVFTGIIYLKSNVNKCYESIISDNKDLEKTIEFDYIQKLHINYESWISDIKKSESVDVLEIDVEKFRDLDGNEKTQERLMELLMDRFKFLEDFIKVKRSTDADDWTVVRSRRINKPEKNNK